MKKSNNKVAYQNEAKSIFENQVKANFGTCLNKNIWRGSWAFDTLIDYFNTVDDSSSSELSKTVLTTTMNAMNGDWWDDYGWDGIASLRAAENLNLDDTTKATFIQNAINSWCYMYGMGWKIGGMSTFDVPYPSICNWQERISSKDGDIGARNVFTYWKSKNTPSYWAELQPKYDMGGIWNTTNNANEPVRTMNPCSHTQELEGIQNTVTNAVFMLLSLRLYKFSLNPAYSHYFTDVAVDTRLIRSSWLGQLKWFDAWFNLESGSSSMKYDINPAFAGTHNLIRERAPQLINNLWSPGYCNQLGWTGDQGLVLGAFRESIEVLSNEGELSALNASSVSLYGSIINAVSLACFSTANYSGLSVPVLRPWVQYQTVHNVRSYNLFPAGDDADYQTGIAVFARYLQQAIEAGYQTDSYLKQKLLDTADCIVEGTFATENFVTCDGFYPNSVGSNSPDEQTAWINQLAVLCLAIKLS